jgi:uncharacterized lipoprotein YddW (UPF0748 family)
MKQIICSILVLILTSSLFAQTNEEFRATWIVDYQWLSPNNTVEQNKALTREILDNHKKANMTSVLWQVRRFGSVYYPSTIEPWGPQAGSQDPGYDPLAYAIEQAHARGLEFHAWFNTFESRYAYTGSPAEQHPEWICRDQDGIVMPAADAWLSPGLQAVREYLLNVALEIVKNYDIDGLHLDFVRWSELTNSSSSLELARQSVQNNLPDGVITEEQLHDLISNRSGRYLYDVDHPYSAGIPQGFNTWEEWWRWSVTEFVHTLHDSIQAVKPWVRLSPAALGRYNWGGWQGYGSVYQDAALWLNEGYIDQLIGMHYHWNTAGDIYNVLQGSCPQCWFDFIQPAIQAGRLYSVGLFSDDFANDGVFYRHESIIDTVRSVSWADGFQFFSYESWDNLKYWDEAKSLFFNHKTKIRATKLIESTPPEAPAISFSKLDSLNYEIDVTPPASEPLWFAIYRSEDNSASTDSDEIVEVHFGDAQFSYTDSFTGTQDYDGIYWYFATALDRYWNESDVSNVELSDSIPSFAPTVTSTSPAEGDTIPANNNIEITFSKTMDLNSFQNAISFNPTVNISQLTWSSDHKTVTVDIDGDFDFATNYALTIEAFVTDINGRALDGNGDGMSGDPLLLSFTTLGQDVTGPLILYSFPDVQGTEQNFTVDEVITFQFDEIVDGNSLIDSSISLTKDGVDVPAQYNLTNVNDQSILSLQSTTPLENDQNYVITLSQEITDTLGNQMSGDVTVNFKTSLVNYSVLTMIEDFTFATTNWWQPDGSGSTVGIIVPNTIFGYQSQIAPPASLPKKAASLRYEWDPSASEWLIREYLAGGAPRNVLFDTTYVLQCYVFGDGSNNEFRFAVDDNVPQAGAENHEVSQWISIDWVGWRIVEWRLNDPNSVGTWIGNGILEGTLRFDSFQMTHEIGDDISGQVYFDNLRLVKKIITSVDIAGNNSQIPDKLELYQNYPNPFNPSTIIAFDIPENGLVKLTIYDVLGREIEILINKWMNTGHYEFRFDRNASGLASGVYIYRISMNNTAMSRRMLLLK